jgi:hypothetical protein
MWSRILIPVLLLAASPSFANPAPEIRKALVWASDGSVSVQPYELLEDGRAVFQGDMVLPLDADGNVRLFLERPKSTGFRGLLWNDAILYYDIDPALTLAGEVEAAVSEWEALTGMRLIRRTTQRDYIWFTTETRSACFSYYGRRGGRQSITLNPSCSKSAILHEIGHAVGLFHEQSRTDRDDYVNLHLENADPTYWYAFDVFHPAQGYNSGSYDHNSIMHYHSFSFSTNQQPTITKKDGSLIPYNRVLSPGDLAGIRALYGLADLSNLLQNPGFEAGVLSPWTKGPSNGPGIVAVEKCCNKTPGGKWNGAIRSRGPSVEMIQKVSVTPGRTYRLSATVSTKGLTANLKWYSNVTGDQICASTRVRWPSVDQLTCEFTVPDGTTKFNVGLSGSGPSGKSALSDDWTLTDITAQ